MEDDLNKLVAVFGKVTVVDARYEVYATAKFYPKFTKVFVPNKPYLKSDPFVEEVIEQDKQPKVLRDKGYIIEDDIERSLRHTKTLIADYVLCNEFDLFATFTFSPKKTTDRFNAEIVKLQMANWLKNQAKRYGKFAYLIVPEFHSDKKALHFHALFKDYKGVLVDSGKNSKGRPVFYFKSYTLGFNSAVLIDNPEKVSSYVRKYISKDMPQFRGKHRFWATRGLIRPRTLDNPALDDLGTMTRHYQNEYGLVLYYVDSSSSTIESHSLTDDSPTPPPQTGAA